MTKPTRGPNANGFALQWNIGCYCIYHIVMIIPDSGSEHMSYDRQNDNRYVIFF